LISDVLELVIEEIGEQWEQGGIPPARTCAATKVSEDIVTRTVAGVPIRPVKVIEKTK